MNSNISLLAAGDQLPIAVSDQAGHNGVDEGDRDRAADPENDGITIDFSVPDENSNQDCDLSNTDSGAIAAGSVQVGDCAAAVDNAQAAASAISDGSFHSTVPSSWIHLLDKQFAGKQYGVCGFGPQYKVGLLAQIVRAKIALELASDAASAESRRLTLEQWNEIIDSCDTSSSPLQARIYVQPVILATLREDVGRAMFKAMQARSQMLGVTFDSFVASLTSKDSAHLTKQDTVSEPSAAGEDCDRDPAEYLGEDYAPSMWQHVKRSQIGGKRRVRGQAKNAQKTGGLLSIP